MCVYSVCTPVNVNVCGVRSSVSMACVGGGYVCGVYIYTAWTQKDIFNLLGFHHYGPVRDAVAFSVHGQQH